MRTHFFIPCLLPLILATPSHAADSQTTPIRIGLCRYFNHAATVLVSSAAGFTIKDAASGRTLAHGTAKTVYRIAPGDKGLTLTREDYGTDPKSSDQAAPVTISADSDAFVRVARIDGSTKRGTSLQWHTYRGDLTVRRQPDKTMQLIDLVPLEEYLYGVIPAEIGVKVPMEAMKAQAVAARTYALKNRNKFGSEGFDLDDTTRCEGYAGVEGETVTSNAAVDATRGQVLTYHGALIDAPYSSDSGGMTACDINGDCPYLQAVRDAPTKDGPDYACTGKYHTWSKEYTSGELSAILAHDPRTRVSKFVSLAIDGTDASGRITTATVAGSDGTMKTVTGPQLRQILGYDVLRSTLVAMTVTADGNYRFDGKGWGHGLGMSQDGAIAMAAPPYSHNYKEILAHYYVNTALVHAATLPAISVASVPHGL